MKRSKDLTPVECKLCKKVLPASGMGSHLYHTHPEYNSDSYARKYGEFRKKYIKLQTQVEKSDIVCKVCNTNLKSHKALLHHIHTHKLNWEDYFIKYFFDGKHPTCSCGCGEKVTLLRHGKNEKGEITYSRDMLPGHHKHRPGYRVNSKEQRERMRVSAIERMKKGEGTYFNNGPSKAEQELFDFIKSIIPDALQGDKEILSGMELDIVIPSLKIAIEYNGGYCHSDLFKEKKYHLTKQEQAKEKGYRLIHIWECDWINKKEIIKSIIKNIVGKTERKIFARKTQVREIRYSLANKFLADNHLQGSGVSKIRLGLFFNQELVSVMTFSSLRRATGQTAKEGSYELLRFCNKLNTSVVGGASKMLNYFKETYKPTYILSYANKDWSIGTLYNSLNMKYTGNTAVGYFYTKSKIRFSRYQFQKHKLVANGKDINLSEYEIMLKDGYYRVWDCGNLRFEWNN